MYKLEREETTPKYTGRIQEAPEAKPRKQNHKKYPNPQEEPTHRTKTNKDIDPSLKYTLTQDERLQRNKTFITWSFCSLS